MPPRVQLGVNLNFAKYVYGPVRALEIVREEFGLRYAEIVADNDFGPALYLRDPAAFRAYHRGVAQRAAELGVSVPCVFTTYRDCGAIGWEQAEIRESAYHVGLSIIEQAACYAAPNVGISFFTLNVETAAVADKFRTGRAHGVEIWQRWMTDARKLGVERLLVEMAAARREECSTLAETAAMLAELMSYHRTHPDTTVPVGLVYDTGHGIDVATSADDRDRDYHAWFETFADSTYEVHLKDTDPEFLATWHFNESSAGIINIKEVITSLRDTLTVPSVLLNLEIPGKRGRAIGEERAIAEHQESLRWVTAALEAADYRQDSADGAWVVA